MTNFFLQEVLTVSLLTVFAWGLGQLVLKHNVRVNYTRKALRILLLVIPLSLFQLMPYEATVVTCFLKGCVLTGIFFSLSLPVRSRVPFVATCFAAVDRPEDRPHTLLLLTSQSVACFAVIIGTAQWLQLYGAERLLLIGLLVDGLGDALAEPVGVAFGRYKYRAWSPFGSTTQIRTLEGSLCVFASALFAVVLVQNEFAATGFWIAVGVIPILLTVAEAVSPHTWDGPFLYFTSAASGVGVLEFNQWLQSAALGG